MSIAEIDNIDVTEKEISARQRRAIDLSCRVPVLNYTLSAIFWLLIGSVLAVVASVKLHDPEFLSNSLYLTFGRVRMAHLQAVGLGWSALAVMAASVWLMCRLCRIELFYPKMLLLGCHLWNVGMVLDIIGILIGDAQSVEWLDAPRYTPPFFVASVVLISAWCVAKFRRRTEKHVYVTQWYILAAMVWFPWLYTVSVLMIFWLPTTGVIQPIVNWWFAHNYLGLWLTPVAIGSAYYLIPKVLGRPIHSYYLSVIGFWSLALFYSWAGMHHLVGGPVPAWLVTASIVGSVMMFIPVITVAINHHMTLIGNFHRLKYSPTLRFTVFGAIAYTLVSAQGAIESIRSFNEVTHFTHYTIAHAHLGVYAFFTMIMFGLMYYMIPRLTGRDWPSVFLIRTHFWAAAVGIALYFVSLTVAGWWQGRMLNNPSVPFAHIVDYTLPFLLLRSLSGILLTVGHIAFAISVAMNLFGYGVARNAGPVYFNQLAVVKSVR